MTAAPDTGMTAQMPKKYSEARFCFGTQKMPFRCLSHSLTGARPDNQDRALCFGLGRDQFALLCDGLGGYPDGQWAAATFAEVLRDAITRQIPAEHTPPRQALEHWLQQAWQQFCLRQQQEGRHEQAQTTFTLAWLSDGFCLLAHAGDSRIYRLDARQILWRSQDHNLYALAVLNGDIDPHLHPVPQGRQTLLYRSVSSQKPLKPTISEQPALTCDTALLLCSDGAWQHIPEQDWTGLVGSPDPATRLPQLLQQAVESAGAKADNCSAILLLCEDAPAASDPTLPA